MSSSPNRAPLPGVIRQNEKVVGAVCLPEKDLLEFIEEFNNCYGPLSMHIDAPAFQATDRQVAVFPVGAHRLLRGSPPAVAQVDSQICPDL